LTVWQTPNFQKRSSHFFHKNDHYLSCNLHKFDQKISKLANNWSVGEHTTKQIGQFLPLKLTPLAGGPEICRISTLLKCYLKQYFALIHL
jgi:hypothetical protein